MLPLQQASDRLLNLVAAIFSSDNEATVVLSPRLTTPCIVALGSRTIFLDPDTAGLRDLVVAARILTFRHQAERTWKGRGITPAQARRWTWRAVQSLRNEYPNYASLGGRFDRTNSESWPEVTWKDVELRPLDALYGSQGLFRGGGRVHDLPGVNITGHEEDMNWMLEAIAAGRFPVESYRPLQELPTVTVRYNLTPTGTVNAAGWDAYQEEVRDFAADIPGLVQCFARKAEADHAARVTSQRLKTGIHLDTRRLVDAAIAARTGIEPALFFNREHSRSPVLDPSQYLSIMAVDANSLRRGSLGDPGFSHRALAMFIEVHKRLGVDFVLLSFSDQILTLPDGRDVYVHSPCVIHDCEDRFNTAFYKRFLQLLEHPPRLAGRPACFAPLVLRTVGRWFEMVADRERHTYRRMILAIRRGMPEDPRFDADEFLARTADTLDQQIRQLKGQFENGVNDEALFFPTEVQRLARPRGPTASSY